MKPALVDVSVLILFFNRPKLLAQVFEQVKKARPARLFLYQDGPRGERDMPGIEACRKVVADIDWECEVHHNYQEKNYGCDPSEYMAQKWAFSLSDKCIVLEDDDVPAVSFFGFCKELLDKYEHDTRISMIAGFNNEEITPDITSDYFFATTFSIWGWASWRRVTDQWDEFYTFLDDKENMRQLKNLIHTMRQLWSSDTTEIWSVCLSRTSSLALMPWFLSDSIRRLAAMAAPPMRSDVLISSTLMTVVRFFFFECFFLLQMPVLFHPFPDTLLQRLPYDGEVAVP